MQDQGLASGPIENAQLLGGGTQNIIVAFDQGSRRYVLRRPALRPRANGNETMGREARVLAALAGTDIPHPQLIAFCGDQEVIGASFYIMQSVDGFNATVSLPPLNRGDPHLRREMGMALVDALAALGRIDHIAVGLSGFGKTERFLERQVPRWQSQLEGYRSNPGWPGPLSVPGVSEVATWLERNRPVSFVPGIMHGDYQLSNVLFRLNGSQVAAIVDWELATIGDPLIDLGWLLATWPETDGSGGTFQIEPWEGFPTAGEIVERYAAGTARDLCAVKWYVVFACFKLGILLEGSYARACCGDASKETGDRLHGLTLALFRRALERIG
jgi:aminoglycoside phosphotransferase (APT) family kinase protein